MFSKQILLISIAYFVCVIACPGGVVSPKIPYSTTTPSDEKRLIKLSEDDPGQWLEPDQIEALVNMHANFVDITNRTIPISRRSALVNVIPKFVRLQLTVLPMLEKISIPEMQKFIKEFSSFHNRFYKTKTGLASQKWLLEQVQKTLRGYSGQAAVQEYPHHWPQSSVVATIGGSDSSLTSQVVILGAHQDSINRTGWSKNAPGADDNASGSAILLETLRVIVDEGFIPKRTLEFHWYAAEEIGLRGSGDIAEDYSNNGANVVSMLNYDVAGYHTEGINDIGIYTDHTNPELTQFLRLIVDNYCEWGWQNQTCGYGCSDHASWNSYGFPTAMASEIIPNPHMHTIQDHYDIVEFPQLLEFAKVGLGYAVEMSG